MSKKAVTLQQIADRCNLSKSTVAYILRQPENCSARESTKKLVFETAQAMGYTVNNAARALSTGSYRTIGILFPSTDAGYGELIMALDRALKAKGYLGLFSFWENDSFPIAVKNICNQGIDGIISLEIDPILKKCGKPVVIFGNPWENYDCVFPDKGQYAIDTFNYLTRRGYKKIGYIGLTGEKRARVLIEKIIEAGLPFKDEWFVDVRKTMRNAEKAMNIILGCPERPDVIVLHSDIMAGQILKCAREHGICIPEDIALISYDNLPESAFTTPALTTFEPQIEKLAMMLLDTLLMRLDDPALPVQHHSVPLILIERDSVPIKQS